MTREVCVAFQGITKRFPGVVALDQVNLEIKSGEIHALLGENGAGKSTLMNVLYGLYRQDEGQILLNGRVMEDNSPRRAIDNGIGMIHQHFMLIPVFTVLENIVLGQASARPPLLELSKWRKDVSEIARQFNIQVNLDAPVGELAIGMQQKVEILKALYRGADVLILDEPTSVLTPQEGQDLFRMLFELKRTGCTIVFISHKLNEVMQISDRITVLRDGRLIRTVSKAETDPRQLSRLMVGRDAFLDVTKQPSTPGAPALVLEDVTFLDRHGLPALSGISLSLRCGEILGIAGVDGNGQKELAEVIAGLQRASSGRISLFGQDVTVASPRRRIEMGLSFIPADRQNQGLVADFTVAENLVLGNVHTRPFSRGISLDRDCINSYARQLIAQYDVKTPSAQVPVKHLSGGNQQKVIVGREMAKRPRVILVMQPTWGLDIGACEFIYGQLLAERDKGAAVLLISTELEEVAKLSDRMAVIFEGRIVGDVDPRSTPVEEIGLMMAGSMTV